jgi:Histidine kinase-, DNA gyrase B-, and HSP90-like ATPase
MSREKTEEQKLIADIAKNQKTGKVSLATLRTDDRVLARITDGIYRQPASALRELISNAYDADATTVIIQTDAPRFDQITVRDDGNGMDIAALARLIHHIGGSAKRRDDGVSLGVTNKRDSSLSPKGRRLIGKIGIGLFSVSQLTRHFQIITKVAGKDYRLVAEVILRTYSENEIAKRARTKHTGVKIDTGHVRIVSVPAEDVAVHGTEVILLDLRPQAKDLLQSKETWDLISAGPIDALGVLPQVRVPSFHVGQVDKSGSKIIRPAKLPWADTDKPEDRFRKLYQGIVDDIGTVEQNPRLETALDNYLRTLWTLSLAAPVSYIEGHPFDIKKSNEIGLYELQPSVPGKAHHLDLKANQRIRDSLDFHAPERGSSNLPFRVFVDDVELLRPIRFTNLPKTDQAIKKPMLFLGSAAPDLSKISTEERGGDLEFEAYFLWAPKIVPKENNGLLIRISDASGTLFDETFAKYQISELTRLKQITAEIFILKGLDAALNIDRESFNYAHPHYQYIMRWVHRALRQLVNTLKQVAADVRTDAIATAHAATSRSLDTLVEKEVVRGSGDTDATPADVDLSGTDATKIASERKKGRLALNADKVFQPLTKPKRGGKKNKGEQQLFRRKIRAVAQVLDAYGLLEKLTYDKQEELLRAIVAIFSVDKGH